MKILHVLLAAVFLISLGDAVQAQEDEYKDLLFLIIDGEYEKAATKAERITDRDKTRREVVPHIYASMAYYEMSKREEFQEDYPRAFREAIKFAYKAKRYDDENEYMPDHAQYLNELKAEVMKEARFHFEAEDYRKSTTYSKYTNRIDPNDLSALLLKGVAEVRGRNAYQAERTFEEADEALKEFSVSDVSLEMKEAYLYSVMEFAKLMKEEGKKAEAQPYLDAVAPLFEENPQFEDYYASY
jgi:tetratricopeptide (TPR) repeat protein